MIQNRLPHSRATGSTSGRGPDETPRPACLGKSEPYDVLIDHISGPGFDEAVRQARNICGGCPLFATCLRENSDQQWAAAVMGRELRADPLERDQCGSRYGFNTHTRNREKPCEACAQANRDAVADYTARRKAAA